MCEILARFEKSGLRDCGNEESYTTQKADAGEFYAVLERETFLKVT